MRKDESLSRNRPSEDFIVDSGTLSVRSTPSQIRNYASNQAIFATSVETGERFSALINFINFTLDYEDDEDDWLDRTDNSLGLTLSYKYSPKTSFFLEYDRAVISYATDTGNDSENSFLYGGINWQGSAKTSLVAKGGYQLKQYDIENYEDSDTFSLEAQLKYLVTDKTKIGFNLYRALEETDSLHNRGRETTAARLRYDQRFSYRTSESSHWTESCTNLPDRGVDSVSRKPSDTTSATPPTR